ncbi:MAG: MarR family transcriptional regulator [Fimbriimonadaceae bacterium]|nr:MarR family transcriptional regulator [Alphaproteobacteria bacterium]
MSGELDPTDALRFWHDVSLDLVRDTGPELSPRQMAILLTIYLEPPPHNVRDLAKTLGVTKPVITRALDSMGKLGLVSRRRDKEDRRNIRVSRTVEGALYLEQLADHIRDRAKDLKL